MKRLVFRLRRRIHLARRRAKMLYQRPKFSCPAAGQKTSQENWDRAFLNKEQFESKYGKDSYTEAVPQADGTP